MTSNTDSTDDAAETTPDSDDGVPDDDQSKDLIFDTLKNRRRRMVVQYLQTHGEADLGELAENIAADENDTTVEDLSAGERKRVYIGLYQSHLPKMDDAGFVEYDQDRGTVSPTPAIEQLYPYLEPGDDTGDTGGDARTGIDLSGLTASVTLPASVLFAAILVVGLVGVAATGLPGPTWAIVLVAAAALATWGVRWQ